MPTPRVARFDHEYADRTGGGLLGFALAAVAVARRAQQLLGG